MTNVSHASPVGQETGCSSPSALPPSALPPSALPPSALPPSALPPSAPTPLPEQSDEGVCEEVQAADDSDVPALTASDKATRKRPVNLQDPDAVRKWVDQVQALFNLMHPVMADALAPRGRRIHSKEWLRKVLHTRVQHVNQLLQGLRAGTLVVKKPSGDR